MVRITLTREQILYAATQAVEVTTDCTLADLERPQNENNYNRWNDNVVGALGELAVAIYAGHRAWRFGPGSDVDGVEVRACPRPNARLFLQERDQADSPMVLVAGEPPTVRLCGWIYVREGRLDEHWDPKLPKPTWAVPQKNIHRSMESLREMKGWPAYKK